MCIANPVTCIWETRTHRRLKPMALCSFTFQPTCQGSIPCVCRMAKMPQRGPNTERYDSYALGDGRQMARLVTEVSHLLPSWWEVGRTRMITFIARICPGNNSQRTGPSIRPCLWRLVLFSGTLESREKSHSSVWGHCWSVHDNLVQPPIFPPCSHSLPQFKAQVWEKSLRSGFILLGRDALLGMNFL